MTPVEILSQLSRRGATLAVDGERLRIRPSEALDDESASRHRPAQGDAGPSDR